MKVLDIAYKDFIRSLRSMMFLGFGLGLPLLLVGIFYFAMPPDDAGEGFQVSQTSVQIVNLDQPAASYPGFSAGAILVEALESEYFAELLVVTEVDDVADAPERYKVMAALMHFEMLGWQNKDLGWISRKMNNIERRLDLARGGPQTQKMQKEVVMRLDELIKELENQQKSGCGS